MSVRRTMYPVVSEDRPLKATVDSDHALVREAGRGVDEAPSRAFGVRQFAEGALGSAVQHRVFGNSTSGQPGLGPKMLFRWWWYQWHAQSFCYNALLVRAI